MITYETKDDKTYKITTIREEIDVEALEAELKEWQEMEEPSDEELKELGKIMSPYYVEREQRIERLNNKLKAIK